MAPFSMTVRKAICFGHDPGKAAKGPEFTKQDLYSEMWAEHVYRYFGQAPYWTEGELVEKGVKPTEVPRDDFGGSYLPYGYMP